ncbi:MAG: ABC transporter substrate-binding protein [Acidimicrobiales bacterium]
MKIRRNFRIAAGVTAAAVVFAACGSSPGSSSPGGSSPGGSGSGAVVEATVIAYTGTNAFEGGVTDAGAYPAAYEINSAGGILGHQLNISPIDTRGDPADALPAVQKMLATTGNLVGVTGAGTTSGPTILPVLNGAQMTTMASAGEAKYDRNTYPYFWRLVPPDPVNGEAMALWAKKQGLMRVAAVFGTDSSSQGALPGVLAGVTRIHASLVANVSLTPDQPSYRTQVEQVLASHPDVIMTESDGATGATFFGEMKQLGHLVPVYGTQGTVTNTWLNPVRSAMGSANFAKYYTAIIGGTPKPSPALTAYQQGLKNAASKVPSPYTQWDGNPYAQAFYDGVIVQALAMEAAHSIKPSVYNKDVMAVTEPGNGKTVVYSFAQGKRDLEAGKQIQYIGASGPILFDKYHNSFGNEAAERIPPTGNPTVLGIITEQSIQKLG